MFYVKKSFGYADEITELGRDNIFTRCHECNKEMQYDLAPLAKRFPDDFLNIFVLCDDCSEKYAHQYPAKTPPSLEIIKFLVAALKEKGYDEDVAFMYNTCEIVSLDDLEERDYDSFTADLLDILTGELKERYGEKGRNHDEQ